MSIETQLRDALHYGADELGQVEPPSAVSAAGMIRLDERRRRRRTGALAAGLAAVLVGVAVPVGLSLVGSAGNDTGVAAPPSIPDVASGDIFGGPTRGSLAADTVFVEAVRQRSWGGAGDGVLPDPALDTKRVVYAGEVAGQRWALVVAGAEGGASGPLETAWFVGPLGAAPEQMTLSQFEQAASADLPAVLLDQATGAFIVIAAPGDVIETSARPEVAADGTVSRNFVDTNSADGTAAVELGASPYQYPMPAAQYRVSRAGQVLAEQSPYVVITSETQGPEIPLDYLRPPVSNSPDAQTINFHEQQLAAGVLASYALSADEVQFRVPYIGPLELADGEQAELTVVTATFPSGAVLTLASWDVSGPDSGFGGSCSSEVPTAAWAAADQLVLALLCDVSVQTSATNIVAGAKLIVIAPPDLGAVTAISQGETADPVTLALSDGVGMVAFPEGAQTVLIADASGATIQEVPINQM